MKKILFTLFFVVLGVGSVQAQKSVVRMQDTQARLLDVNSNAYVKPLVVELEVDQTKGRIRDVWTLTKEQAETEMRGDLSNIRSYAVYMSSKKHNADVIVAATFNVKTNDVGDGYDVEIVGFPANFVKWRTAVQTDLEWIRLEKTLTTADREKISAIVK